MLVEIRYTYITIEDWNRIGSEWPKQKEFRYSFTLSSHFRDRWNIHIVKDQLKTITEWHDGYTLLDEDYIDEKISIEQHPNFESPEKYSKCIYITMK